jgi:PhnB protein
MGVSAWDLVFGTHQRRTRTWGELSPGHPAGFEQHIVVFILVPLILGFAFMFFGPKARPVSAEARQTTLNFLCTLFEAPSTRIATDRHSRNSTGLLSKANATCSSICFSLQCPPNERSAMAKKKIDPLNKKQYGAVSAMLTVSDIPAAVYFYQKALGFSKRGIMNGPDGKPMHAELTLRGTTLMLGPENAAMGKRTAKTLGASPAGLYLYVENVDKVVEKATKLGASGQGPVMDMFWGDRCGTLVDPDGYTWMVGTHKAEPTAKEMKKGMQAMMKQQPASAAAA